MTTRNIRLKDMYYLATPIRHPLPHVPYWRFIAAAEVLTALTLEDIPVFCPLVHNYPISMVAKANNEHKLGNGSNFWYGFDVHYMRVCQAGIAVAHLPGWEDSVGVQEEIEWFTGRGLPTLNLTRLWLEGTLNPKTLAILDQAEELK